MLELLGLGVAALSMSISGATAWLTLGRRGRLRCAQPPTVYFGPDGGREQHPKVFVRLLLYSTASRGHIVEGMFARMYRGDSVQTFGIWVVGKSGDLHRGAGIAIRQDGTALDHHFLLPQDGTTYRFLAGDYRLEVFATVVGRTTPHRLASVELAVSDLQAERLRADNTVGLYYDWSAETGRYYGHLDRARPPDPLPFYMLAPEPRSKRPEFPSARQSSHGPQAGNKPINDDDADSETLSGSNSLQEAGDASVRLPSAK